MATQQVGQDQLSLAQAAQLAALLEALYPSLSHLWEQVDLQAVDISYKEISDILEPLVGQFYVAGQGVGEQFYSASRLTAGLETPYTTVLGPDLVPEALTKSLEGAGPHRFKQLVSEGKTTEEAKQGVLDSQFGVINRIVQNGSRGAVLANVKKDNKAVGWARLSSTGTPCAFCAMLISRGPVYKSKRAAEFEIPVHDTCHCFAEPFYTDQAQFAPIAKEYRDLYDEATQNTSGRDSLNAFRRAYQHRYMPELYKAQEAQ